MRSYVSRLSTLLVLLNTILYGSTSDGPTISISQGALKGQVQNSRNGRPFEAYLGIPYAAPPIGELRFKSPEPPLKWEGVRDATKAGSACPQEDWMQKTNLQGDEDCLFLNVFVPKLPQNIKKLLPVMVWIHGGGFEMGSGDTIIFGPNYLMDKDVILVTINYRLGILGFLSTEDEVAPGNFGLKDQVAALKWVKENIASFGGDPNSVTIFGESAGGASVHYLVISPLAKGLFHRAIAQSGTALAYWANGKNSREKAFKLAKIFECPKEAQSSSSELLKCLQNIKSYDLANATKRYKEWYDDPLMPFVPVVEPEVVGKKAILTKDPFTLLEEGDYNQVPFMTGVTSEEGAFRTSDFIGNEAKMKDINSKFSEVAPLMLGFHDNKMSSELANKVREFYFGDKSISRETLQEFTNVISDRMFFQSTWQSVKLMASTSRNPVYVYKFDYRGKFSLTNLFTKTEENFGVCHGDDLLYLFDTKMAPTGDPKFPEENKMVQIFLDLWTNFAVTGNPTPNESEIIPNLWNPAKPSVLNYMRLNLSPSMDSGFYEDRIQFWNTLLPHTRKGKQFTKIDL